MTTPTNAQPLTDAAADAQGALDALVATVAGLTQMSLALTQGCLDVQTKLPGLMKAAFEAHLPDEPSWIEVNARTPAELDAAHPPGPGDDLTYHVVTVGREPGLYLSVQDSDSQVLGVPNSKRHRKHTRLEALAWYRFKYDHGDVHKMLPEHEVQPSDIDPPAPTAGPSTASGAA
ncbi:hypothetical protein B0H12DRAFT_1241051 [Mycena haematopus]|nr:hypothetical protein B0H12DRAFT_1241752 [Mycena haematopus]KAJ7222852.1 hypothetical protein B0H12DRAFT_1241051 [Mycena haematopus]